MCYQPDAHPYPHRDGDGDPEAAATEPTPGPGDIEYIYDGDGNMMKSVIDGVETYYVGQYYEKVVEGVNETIRKHYFARTTRIAICADGTLYWLICDHLGSTSVTANSNGRFYNELRYSALERCGIRIAPHRRIAITQGKEWTVTLTCSTAL